jgi:hypothetical protein
MKPGKPRVYDPATIAYIEYLEDEVDHLRKKVALNLKHLDHALELADQAKYEDIIELHETHGES